MIDLSSYARRISPQNIVVYGLGKSGLAATRALCAAGISVYVHDDNPDQLKCGLDVGGTALSPDFSELHCAAALILNPAVSLSFPAPHPVVNAARAQGVPVIGDIELFSYAGTNAPSIGITGTNGKSTTTALTAHILNHAGRSAIPCGNIGTPILEIDITTPETQIVIEMSSFQLDLCPIFRPDIAAHLNITPDHLDRHGDLAGYIAVKERIFEGSGIGFCGIDDDASRTMFARAQKNTARRMIPVSCTSTPEDGIFLDDTCIVDRAFEGRVLSTISNLPTLRGKHNYQNALFAYGITRALGVGPDQIYEALHTYPGLPHRQVSVRTLNGVEYINDSKATNADATDKALQTFHDIYWIVGGLPKAGGLTGLEPYAPRMRRAYLIGTAADDFSAFMRAQKIDYVCSGTLDAAVSQAHNDAQKDVVHGKLPGVVLLSPACASYDQFKSYADRGDVFTDLVKNLDSGSAVA